jgi:chromosome segregation ATPase
MEITKMNSRVKNTILKIGMAVLATLLAGNGYELIQEVRVLQSQVSQMSAAFQTTTRALETVSDGLSKTRSAANQVTSQCSAAHSEAIRVRSSIEKLREQIEELRRKLRLQTKVIPDSADRSDTGAPAQNVGQTN